MEVLDPHTVAGLLKLHFREQKTSLIPRGLPLSYLMMHVKNRDVRGNGFFDGLPLIQPTLGTCQSVLIRGSGLISEYFVAFLQYSGDLISGVKIRGRIMQTEGSRLIFSSLSCRLKLWLPSLKSWRTSMWRL